MPLEFRSDEPPEGGSVFKPPGRPPRREPPPLPFSRSLPALRAGARARSPCRRLSDQSGVIPTSTEADQGRRIACDEIKA